MFQPRLERVSEEEREEKKEKRKKTERERMRGGKGWHCSTMAELLFVVERRESGEGGREGDRCSWNYSARRWGHKFADVFMAFYSIYEYRSKEWNLI